MVEATGGQSEHGEDQECFYAQERVADIQRKVFLFYFTVLGSL
jgi:hypothetical protein